MTTTLSRQQEMTQAIGAKNDESRSRTRSQSKAFYYQTRLPLVSKIYVLIN